ncbi:hypothetical protein ASF69_21575 [Rhizobium sp. Leaf311]|nr:hypothetical protein ASF69_21575 [Rhizobium sp. Leaf311]
MMGIVVDQNTPQRVHKKKFDPQLRLPVLCVGFPIPVPNMVRSLAVLYRKYEEQVFGWTGNYTDIVTETRGRAFDTHQGVGLRFSV